MLTRYVLPSLAYLVALVILLSFGTWQVQRLAWKTDLIARVEARVDAPPIPLPPLAERRGIAFAAANEYRAYSVTGRFHVADATQPDFRHFYTYTLLNEPRGPLGGQGYWVMDLFEPDGGGAIYVNRGFVPRTARGRETLPPAGSVTLSGLLRRSSAGNAFTPPCEPAAFTCYVNDLPRVAALAALAALAGVAEVAPFYVDMRAALTPASGMPQAGETRVSFPNNHLQYVVTWYGLAAALTGVFAVFMGGRWRANRAQA
ncbi:MAG: SURF1 family protein [Alphaproteobacteria bacterium]